MLGRIIFIVLILHQYGIICGRNSFGRNFFLHMVGEDRPNEGVHISYPRDLLFKQFSFVALHPGPSGFDCWITLLTRRVVLTTFQCKWYFDKWQQYRVLAYGPNGTSSVLKLSRNLYYNYPGFLYMHATYDRTKEKTTPWYASWTISYDEFCLVALEKPVLTPNDFPFPKLQEKRVRSFVYFSMKLLEPYNFRTWFDEQGPPYCWRTYMFYNVDVQRSIVFYPKPPEIDRTNYTKRHIREKRHKGIKEGFLNKPGAQAILPGNCDMFSWAVNTTNYPNVRCLTNNDPYANELKWMETDLHGAPIFNFKGELAGVTTLTFKNFTIANFFNKTSVRWITRTVEKLEKEAAKAKFAQAERRMTSPLENKNISTTATTTQEPTVKILEKKYYNAKDDETELANVACNFRQLREEKKSLDIKIRNNDSVHPTVNNQKQKIFILNFQVRAI